jgi:flavodoxin
MNALVIFFSQFGNTRRIAEAIAGALSQAGTARVVSMAQYSVDDLHEANLVVVGSPTHYQAVPKSVRSFLKALPRHSLRGKRVAAFDTSLKVWSPIMLLTAAHGITARLRKLGGKRVVQPRTFLVRKRDLPSEGEVDLLCDGEMDRAQAWAQTMLKTVESRGR